MISFNSSTSIMASNCVARYSVSLICILCCLFLPLTVEWLPEHSYNLEPILMSENSNIDYLFAFYSEKNSINSTAIPTLTYYHFELHLLIFLITILSCSSFIQMYFYSKLVMMLVALSIYAKSMNEVYDCLAGSLIEPTRLAFLKAQIFIQMFFYIIFFFI